MKNETQVQKVEGRDQEEDWSWKRKGKKKPAIGKRWSKQWHTGTGEK